MKIKRLTYNILIIFNLICSSLMVIGQNSKTTLPQLDQNSTNDVIHQYESNLGYIIENPKIFNGMPLWSLKKEFYPIRGFILKGKISDKEWYDLRNSETKFIGILIFSLKSRIDPSFDPKNIKSLSLFVSYPPYEMVYTDPKDRQDEAKRKAYNDSIAAKIKLSDYYTTQIELQRALPTFVRLGKEHLRLLYPDQNIQNPDELAMLHNVGLDQATIDLLTKP